jgi:formylglycine-generating enzyme required for sulfatase activity
MRWLAGLLLWVLACVAGASRAQAPAATAPPSSTREFRDCADCPEMVRLPGGTFQMGDVSGGGEANEKPAHSVTLGAFAIGKYEVTRGEYAAFIRDSGWATGGDCYTLNSAGNGYEKQASATWRSPGFSQSERDPVVCVSWEDAKAYVAWLSQKSGQRYRPLSESEWEYAARGGSPGKFWWGAGDNDHCGYANAADQTGKQKFSSWTTSSCNDGQLYTAPAGTYRPNGFGLYDTAGNAWEWLEDCYADTYDLQPRNGAAYTSGTCAFRVLRGGSWNYGPQGLRSAIRGRDAPSDRINNYGFRVARSAPGN